MIISHKHRFIFQHCRKTAGSSIQVMLNPHLGSRDLQIGAWNDVYSNGGRGNSQFWQDVAGSPVALLTLIKRALKSGKFDPGAAHKRKYTALLGPSPEHAPAKLVRRFAPQAWESYFKFCFVRNPYDKFVSDWKWRTRSSGVSVSFDEFMQMLARGEDARVVPNVPDNWPIYTIDNEIAVDFVGRFENFEADLHKVFCELGFPQPTRLVRSKFTLDRTGYRQYYTKGTQKIAEQLALREIDRFGYLF